MKNKIKKLLVNLVFTEEQKKAIWESVRFSETSYSRHGKMYKANQMLALRNFLSTIF